MLLHQRFFSLLCLLLLQTACTEPATKVVPMHKDGKQYGVNQGAFRSRWWNHYERGLSFAEGGFLAEAEADLRKALNMRGQDQRRARTYGLHFVDFFGHRELGVILYRQGRLQEAMQELEASLSTVKSAKAELYLDRVRRDWVLQQKLDRIPPSIQIDTPLARSLVQEFSIKVKGIAEDDTFVKQIKVNGIPVRIDLAAERIPFEVNVPLQRAENRIEVEVVDIIGRVAKTLVRVDSDREGPVLGIQEATPGARLKGYVDDPSGLAEVKVNGRPVPLSADGALQLDAPLPSAIRRPSLLIEAVDRAGNFTIAQIDFTDRMNRRWNGGIMLAAAGGETRRLPRPDVLSGANRLHLNYRGESGDLYLDRVYLQGRVSMPAEVSSVKINGVELLRRAGKNVFFTHRIGLEAGRNKIRIIATDNRGAVLQETLVLNRALKHLEKRQARYRLALVPEQSDWQNALDPIWNALQAEKRYRPAGDSPISVGLLKPGERLSPSDAADLIKGKEADGLLLTRVKEGNDSLEYIVQVIDVSSGKPALLVDAYQASNSNAQTLAEILLEKLADRMPVVGGRIVGKQGEKLTVSFDPGLALYEILPVWVFRDGNERRDPVSNALLGADQVILGRGRIQSLTGKQATIALDEPNTAGRIEVDDRVQTR